MSDTPKKVNFDSLRFVQIAHEVLDQLRDSPKIGPVLREKDRSGGFFVVTDHRGNLLLATQIGACDAELISRFRFNALEKAARLAGYPDHVMSRESRDESLQRYSGAVRGTEYICSASGLPEAGDELWTIGTLTRATDLTRLAALDLLRRFPNELARPDGPEVDNLIYLD